MSTVTHDEAELILDCMKSNLAHVEDRTALRRYITQQRTREAEQQAEIQRLRSALVEILDPCVIRSSDGFRMIARAALNTEGANHG